MRFFVRGLLSALAILVIYSGSSGTIQSKPGAYFNSEGNDLDSQIELLKQRLGYMETKLGVQFHDFDFAIPAGKKLVATFVAKLDDKVVPEMSSVFHIPTTDHPPDKRGSLFVIFHHSNYQSSSQQQPFCEIDIRTPKVSHSYIMGLPFMRRSSEDSGVRPTSTSQIGHVSLEDGKDYDVWNYEAEGKNKPGQPSYVFKFTLKIRLEKFAEGDRLYEITRKDLPAPQ